MAEADFEAELGDIDFEALEAQADAAEARAAALVEQPSLDDLQNEEVLKALALRKLKVRILHVAFPSPFLPLWWPSRLSLALISSVTGNGALFTTF
jgi:hypothetical protein